MKRESVEEVLKEYIDGIVSERNELRARVIYLEETMKECCNSKKSKKKKK